MKAKRSGFSQVSGSARRVVFFATFISLVLFATTLFLDWLQRTGMTDAKWVLLCVFSILATGLSFGFTQALFGFFVIICRRHGISISEKINLNTVESSGPIQSRIALLFPVYNEEPSRFYSGVAATYQALEASGYIDNFSFFILSDSTNPNRWIEEENQWLDITNQLNAHGRIAYRHRISNLNQKSGNVSDFCRRWGAHFDHMICFDADSLMSADSMIKLVRMMESKPNVGIIQTMPGLFGAETLFARLQQFANRIHGEISGAGLNFWQQSEGNYWGHNAIIRLKPFIESCALPELPGPKPLGGRVLSHDFVEAALMRKAGYEVWLAYDIADSFEEAPPTLIDFAQRDRRWCQGNLQHGWIALFGKIPLINRIHMLNGIYAYVAAPLWLLFLFLSTLISYSWAVSGLTQFYRPAKLSFSPDSIEVHGLLVCALVFGMIFLPKAFTIIRLLVEPQFRKSFGGLWKGSASVFIEVCLFSLMAPALMLFHSSFVVSILTGNKVGWVSQNRSISYTTWHSALCTHCGHTVIGIMWGILAWRVNPTLFYWMSPVLLGWIFSIPLSVLTSHTQGAASLRKMGFLLTPEEREAPDIIARLQKVEEGRPAQPLPISALREDFGLAQVILDPYVNALHRSLLPNRRNQSDKTAAELRVLGNRLVEGGATSLQTAEKNRILNDPETVKALHTRIWTTSNEKLHSWWRLALARQNSRSLYEGLTEYRSNDRSDIAVKP